MKWRTVTQCVGISAVGLSLLAGCSQKDSSTSNLAPVPANAETPGLVNSADDPLAKLSDADREAALKQEICPVSGEKLGSMGVPPKLTVDGKEVFICCEGCEEKLREKPAEYFAKLKNPPPAAKSETPTAEKPSAPAAEKPSESTAEKPAAPATEKPSEPAEKATPPAAEKPSEEKPK